MKSALTLIASAAIGGLFALPAFAAGDGGSSTPTCPTGQVYSQQKQMCVDAGAADDDSLTDYAYALAQDGRFEEALATLDLLEQPDTAEALNYRGYATRKLGRIDEGIGYYLQSVARDPEYALVREYLGEAYVTQGKLDLAKEQLTEIEKLCGTTCEPYGNLAEAIESAG